jgi:hypothetical protein
VQHLPLASQKLTPTADPLETLCRPEYKWMNTARRSLQRASQFQLPALLNRIWAESKNNLG